MTKVKENNLVVIYRDGSKIVRRPKVVPDDCVLTERELVEYSSTDGTLGRTKCLIMLHHRLQCDMRKALDTLLLAEGETVEY